MQRAWIYAGIGGMLAMALSSGLSPWGAALAGAFLPADLAADVAAARLFVQGVSPYGPVIRSMHMEVTGLPFTSTLPYFPHPPFSLILGLPMGFMSFQTASSLWFAGTLSLLFVFAVLLNQAVRNSTEQRAIGVAPLYLLLLAWPPVLYNLEKGQWSVLVAVLLTLAWRAVARGDLRTSALWAGAAASVKVFPVVLGAYFLVRSVRATGWFVATGIVFACIPLAWIGFDSLVGFVAESRLNVPYWESFPLVMFSIHGMVSRALVGGQWADPFIHAPVLARVLEALLLAGLVAVAGWITVQAGRGHLRHSCAFLVWLALLPMLNPLSLGHNGVLLALPLLLLGYGVAESGPVWQRWSWSLALIAVSLPNQTVWRLAGLPTAPLPGLVIAGLPTWGALLLFGVAVAQALRRPMDEAATASASAKILTSPVAPSTRSGHPVGVS